MDVGWSHFRKVVVKTSYDFVVQLLCSARHQHHDWADNHTLHLDRNCENLFESGRGAGEGAIEEPVVHRTRDFGDEWRVCEDHRAFVFA
jgi:hypothetical protein